MEYPNSSSPPEEFMSPATEHTRSSSGWMGIQAVVPHSSTVLIGCQPQIIAKGGFCILRKTVAFL